jgi:hypothetical protein
MILEIWLGFLDVALFLFLYVFMFFSGNTDSKQPGAIIWVGNDAGIIYPFSLPVTKYQVAPFPNFPSGQSLAEDQTPQYV